MCDLDLWENICVTLTSEKYIKMSSAELFFPNMLRVKEPRCLNIPYKKGKVHFC